MKNNNIYTGNELWLQQALHEEYGIPLANIDEMFVYAGSSEIDLFDGKKSIFKQYVQRTGNILNPVSGISPFIPIAHDENFCTLNFIPEENIEGYILDFINASSFPRNIEEPFLDADFIAAGKHSVSAKINFASLNFNLVVQGQEIISPKMFEKIKDDLCGLDDDLNLILEMAGGNDIIKEAVCIWLLEFRLMEKNTKSANDILRVLIAYSGFYANKVLTILTSMVDKGSIDKDYISDAIFKESLNFNSMSVKNGSFITRLLPHSFLREKSDFLNDLVFERGAMYAKIIHDKEKGKKSSFSILNYALTAIVYKQKFDLSAKSLSRIESAISSLSGFIRQKGSMEREFVKKLLDAGHINELVAFLKGQTHNHSRLIEKTIIRTLCDELMDCHASAIDNMVMVAEMQIDSEIELLGKNGLRSLFGEIMSRVTEENSGTYLTKRSPLLKAVNAYASLNVLSRKDRLNWCMKYKSPEYQAQMIQAFAIESDDYYRFPPATRRMLLSNDLVL